MKNFAYARPRTETELLELLSPEAGVAEVLAGGTDLVGLMKRMIVTPDRVVDLGGIDTLGRIDRDTAGNLWIGAMVHLDQCFGSRLTAAFPAVHQVIQGISSIQLQSQGTVVGELLHRPRCWYYRHGEGLLADGGRAVVAGDNRYHAILGNRGPAKYVSASRLAPPLISLEAQLRVIGPTASDEAFLPLEQLYQTPHKEGVRENTLAPDQVVTHVILPPDRGYLSAAYEVRHGEGPDPPLAAAAVTLEVADGMVGGARVVLGQVAPVPWISEAASRALIGRPVTRETAEIASTEAVAGVMPLSENEYKVQLAQVAVRRAIHLAAGLEPTLVPERQTPNFS